MASETTGGVEHAVGMPQLDFSTYANQIFWLLITLVLVYLILTRIALPRIAGVLSDRQGTITNDIAIAEDLKLKAEAAEVAYKQALADARTQAQRVIGETKAEITKELAAALAKADTEISEKAADSEARIAEIRASALESVAVVAKDAAGEIVVAFTGKSDARAVTAAVSQRLKG